MGSVFNIPTSGGTLSILHFFAGGSSDGANPWESPLLAANGSTLPGLTSTGCPTNLGSVFSLPAHCGNSTFLHFFTGGATGGASPYGTVIFGASSTLYRMTSAGGPSNNGMVFSFPVTGGSLTYLHFFVGGNTDGAQPHDNLLLSSDTFTL